MDFMEAAQTVGADLGTGGQQHAPAGALFLAVLAWRELGDADPVWDQVGLVLLDVQQRLYPEHNVGVEVQAPQDGPRTRAAVAALITRLAEHHHAMAADGTGALPARLDHDAAAQQLRHAAAVLT
ncbi:hypothetical protein [Actinoplanes regularis]|uniref:hypothetical protein n=1 Tax=Actinoplanes regularis TaxID=52697 RepID=UPI00249FCD8F|nr:hypothetical protein [Actinoplanes regularis]GLW35225.1 hypothetical protein Areg01_81610 [Actinoplanes regularis]